MYYMLITILRRTTGNPMVRSRTIRFDLAHTNAQRRQDLIPFDCHEDRQITQSVQYAALLTCSGYGKGRQWGIAYEFASLCF